MPTLTTLQSFTGADGADPGYGQLLMDANGNLFGTTLSGGNGGGGTVFELVNTGSGYSFQTLASFDSNDTVNGNTPVAGLTMDANGNLFGVTQAGGPANSGTVFELANTGSGYGGLQTLASFSGGAYPEGALLVDANGNLFGTTQFGGDHGQGSVFEIVHTASGYSQPQTVYSFNYTDGAAPTGPLIADANGDLFGTTLQGGTGGQGTVFELVHGASGYSLVTLARFDGSNGSYLYAGLTADAHGDLFGATYSGGNPDGTGYGTVFELVNTGSGYSFETIGKLDYDTTGGYVIGGVTVDSQGDVFGTALAGGTNGFGTVFELVNTGSGYSAPQVVYAFGGGDGVMPEGGVVLDADGNLYGTTAGGGTTGSGTVFEIPAAAPGDGGAAEQAALALQVNGGSGDLIGAAGEHSVAFTVAGMAAGDTGVVTFTDSANHTVTVDVAAGETRYTADFSTLTDGAVGASLQVATNSAGDSFTPVAGNTVTLDTVAPGQPGAPSDAAVVDGYVNAAHDTADQTLGGTTEAGASVAVYDNGALVTTVVAGNSGAWSYNVGTLADGSEHSYAVTATDAAGNISAMSAALSFTVDVTAPTPVVTNVTGADKGQSTVSGVSEAGSTVTLFDGGQKVGVATAGADGTWSVTLKLNGGQVHQFTETAVDLAGNTGASTGAAYWSNPANKAMVGGAGDDVFIGGKGDTLTGGGGHNHFVFNTGFGKQTVTNFASGSDQLWFDHALFGNASQVIAHAQQSGANALITDAAGDQIVLQGVQYASLHAGDFHFF